MVSLHPACGKPLVPCKDSYCDSVCPDHICGCCKGQGSSAWPPLPWECLLRAQKCHFQLLGKNRIDIFRPLEDFLEGQTGLATPRTHLRLDWSIALVTFRGYSLGLSVGQVTCIESNLWDLQRRSSYYKGTAIILIFVPLFLCLVNCILRDLFLFIQLCCWGGWGNGRPFNCVLVLGEILESFLWSAGSETFTLVHLSVWKWLRGGWENGGPFKCALMLGEIVKFRNFEPIHLSKFCL